MKIVVYSASSYSKLKLLIKSLLAYLYVLIPIGYFLVILHRLFSKRKKYKYEVAICLIFKNEAAYLKEWIEYHRLLGVERFYFYDNESNDNTKEIEKWLIVGKDQSEFDRYNVLKCDWEFEWLDSDRKYHRCLGCILEANSYNDGTTSDGFTKVVDNIATFVFPTNKDTRYLDYDTRFMIADSTDHPKTYGVTKITDTSPFGITKGSLNQTLFNEHTDLCKEIDIGDGRGKVMHMICDYYTSTLPPIVNPIEESVIWKLSDVSNKLYVHGQPLVIQAISDTDTTVPCEWHLFVDNVEYTNNLNDLNGYFEVEIDDINHTLTIAAINKIIAKYIVKVAIYDEQRTYYDFVEMEVLI